MSGQNHGHPTLAGGKANGEQALIQRNLTDGLEVTETQPMA